MLEQLLIHLKNWFVVKDGIHIGDYTIEGNAITLPFLVSNQYYRIVGSLFNDGLHKYGDTNDTLTDETFTGAIWALAIPKQVQDLATEISTYQEKNPESPYESESFGGYSYTRGKNSHGNSNSWMDVFRSRLNPWRKL